MRLFHFTLRNIVRGRGSNAIKVISLTLGLFVGILLFAKIASELSFDSHYQDADRLYTVMGRYHLADNLADNSITDYTPIIVGPVPRTLAESFPQQIEAATVVRLAGGETFFVNDIPFTENTVYGDSAFFITVGIPVLRGNVMELTSPDIAFVSDEFARRAFGSEDPVGQTIMLDKNHILTVKGVFRQQAENNSVRPEVVISFANIAKYNLGYFGWYGGDSYYGFVRLRPGVGVEAIQSRIDAAIEQYQEFDPVKNGWGVKYSLEPIGKLHFKDKDVHTRLTVMWILALSLLLMASLNYVLISVSSLTLRSKSIGVHKCNGAGGRNIFAMFMAETGILIGFSLVLVGLLIWGLSGLIEDILGSSLSELFTWQVAWVPLLVILVLFVVAGALPGRLFAAIPVTQVFRRYTEGKQGWKQPLLFVQFAAVSLLLGLLCVIIITYQQISTYKLGYQPEGLASAYCALDNQEVGKATLMGLPMVEDVAFSMSDIGVGWSGTAIKDAGGKILFSSRHNLCSLNYTDVLGIKIKEGKIGEAKWQALVNDEFIRKMRWTDSPIGKYILPDNIEIAGVIEDFVDASLYVDTRPIALFVTSQAYPYLNTITVRLKAPYKDNVMRLNEAVKEAFPTRNMVFSYMPDCLKGSYDMIAAFRKICWVAFAAILLIMLSGLIGYVNDEVRRRSKEIAIRKVNGAEATDILQLLARQVTWIALPAVVIGIVGAYFVGAQVTAFIQRFEVSVGLPLYILMAICVLLIIFGTVIIKSWRIANEDPVRSIKNE